MKGVIPPRPGRDQRLDVARGWLQLTIFASHVAGSFIGGWMIHTTWGLSDSSELFVFLSGFTLGSVFARKALAQGWRSGTADMLARAFRLYRIHLTVFILFGLMVTAAGSTFLPGEAQRLGWGFLLSRPQQALPGVLTMLYQPEFMGILPVFVWCMLLLPGFAALEARAGAWALLPPVACYAAVWSFGLAAPSLSPSGGVAFNPFAWQLVFMAGAWLGRRALLHGHAIRPAHPAARLLTAVAVAILLAGFLLRLGWYDMLPWPAPFAETSAIVGKENLALPRLLHALALAWLVAALMPRDAPWMNTWPAAAVARIGRHSLEVFCLGLFVSWAGSTMLRSWPAQPWLDAAVVLVGGTILALFAGWLDWRRGRARLSLVQSV